MRRLIAVLFVMSLAIPTGATAQTDTAQTDTAASATDTNAAATDTDVQPPVTPAQPPAPAVPVQIDKNKAPQLTHTGWKTLLKDTAVDFIAFPRRQSTWWILGVGGAAAAAVHPADDYVADHITGNDTTENIFALGKWVGSAYVEVGSAVGLWAVGRYIVAPAADKSQTNKYSEVGFDLIRAQIVSQVIVHGIKYSVQRDRPTGECCSFPSGHSATAWAMASVLERHLGYRFSWPFLVGATYVGASRLVDDRHFVSDAVFGAAIGLASGWTVVGTRGRSGFTMQPVPVRGGMMIALMKVNDSKTAAH